jgi:hypothetical protein
MSRRRRARIAAVAVCCLLFQQLALAAYVCAMEQEPPRATDLAGCHPVDAGTPADPLCIKHCDPDASTGAEVRTASVPPLALPAEAALPLRAHAVVLRRAAMEEVAATAHSPPPLLAFSHLLI